MFDKKQKEQPAQPAPQKQPQTAQPAKQAQPAQPAKSTPSKPKASPQALDTGGEKSKKLIIGIFAIAIIILIGVLIYLFIKSIANRPPPAPPVVITPDLPDTDIDIQPGLPIGGELLQSDYSDLFNNSIKAETLTFLQHYQPSDYTIDVAYDNYNLPLDIKNDVKNYYDVSRKINIDDVVSDIDQNGFVIIDNPFMEQGDNFFTNMRAIEQQEIPVYISSDFYIYYQQNILKESFKSIEARVFYPAIWEMARELFNNANHRYTVTFQKKGVVNDPIVEGQRLTAIYWAMVMELLKPDEEQIKSGQFARYGIVYGTSSARNLFNVPDDFADQIRHEVSLIKAANETTKSPVLLYEIDYSKFGIPEEYRTNEPLKNFYLANRWLNTVFPLYYQGDNCSDCLLDETDWKINLIAASYISNDFATNQNLKNLWAKIYKTVSYFKGLRSELHYLNYHDTLTNVFGENYNIAENFENIETEKLAELQNNLSQNYTFPTIEGTYDRDTPENQKHIGMRLLQEPYWPSTYIFDNLKRPYVTNYLGDIDEDTIKNFTFNKTICSQAVKKRCASFPLDAINIIHPIPDTNEYFTENTNYENYQTQVSFIKEQVDDFTIDQWYANTYWTTNVLLEKLLNLDKAAHPIYMKNDNWDVKDLKTAISTWINMQLPPDTIEFERKERDIEALFKNEVPVFVEPNQELMDELINQLKMVTDTLASLGNISEEDAIYKKLHTTLTHFNYLKTFIDKTLSRQPVKDFEIDNIKTIYQKYFLTSTGGKNVYIKIDSFDRRRSGGTIIESINGLKLLLSVYKSGDDLLLSVGPVFNLQENRVKN